MSFKEKLIRKAIKWLSKKLPKKPILEKEEEEYADNSILVNSFLETAKTDLNIAKLLFDANEYSNSVYHLQQFVEKASKSYGLLTETIKPKQIEGKISHNTKSIFTREIIAKQEEYNQLPYLEEVFPDFFQLNHQDQSIDFSGYNKTFKKITTPLIHLNPEDHMWIEEEDVEFVMKIVSQTQIIEESLGDDFKENIPKLFASVVLHFDKTLGVDTSELKDILEDEIKMKELIKATEFQVEIIDKVNFLWNYLFWFSILLSGHNQLTRYPCLSCGNTPKQQYTAELGIISNFELIYQLGIKAIENLEYFIKLKEGIPIIE